MQYKEPACQCRDTGNHAGSIPGFGSSPKKEMAIHSGGLPGKSHGQRNLVGYSPRGRKRVGHNWVSEHWCIEIHPSPSDGLDFFTSLYKVACLGNRKTNEETEWGLWMGRTWLLEALYDTTRRLTFMLNVMGRHWRILRKGVPWCNSHVSPLLHFPHARSRREIRRLC